MAEILFWSAVIGVVLGITSFSGGRKKRGCGRGCATCGNREICYRRRKRRTGGILKN